MTAAAATPRPSPRLGLLQARRLWRLVVAVWVVWTAAFVPALWVVGGAVGPALARLPATGAAPGDSSLIVLAALRGVRPAITLALASALLVLWAFTVLWHAGVVSWVLWSGGRRVRLGEVLGLGMVSWWPYARLSLVALALLLALLGVVWAPLWWGIRHAYHAMAEARLELLVLLGIALTALLPLVVWAATLGAAWLLGQPRRRSAFAAWWRGLTGALRTPLVSLGTVLVWVLPALLATAVPLAVGGLVPAVRGGWLEPLLASLAGALRAFCWVGLFASFAPVSGLLDPGAELGPHRPSGERSSSHGAAPSGE